jgi:hypothetical protein
MRAGRAGVTINAKLDKKQHLTNVEMEQHHQAELSEHEKVNVGPVTV